MPILLAVPATIFIAESRVKQFKSCIFASAIVFTCFHVIDATLLRLGFGEPFFVLEASIIWTATGGVFVINSKDLSLYTVIITGMTLSLIHISEPTRQAEI